MTKEIKFLLVLFFAVFILAFYIGLGSHELTVTQQKTQNQKTEKRLVKKPEVDLVVMNNEYKEKTKTFLNTYEKLLSDKNDLTEINAKISEVNKLEDDLMELTVPTEYKDLHINFVLALNKIENYANSENRINVDDSLIMIEKMKSQYSWLN